MPDFSNPLIVQSDMTVLVEVAAPRADAARDLLVRFAELEKAPEHIHTYRMTPLSLWNAAVAGLDAEEVCDALVDFAKYDVTETVLGEIRDLMGRYGRVWLDRIDGDLRLMSDDESLLDELSATPPIRELLGTRIDRHSIHVRDGDRGALKQAALEAGWPVADEAGFDEAAAMDAASMTVSLRPYQHDAVDAWWRDGGDDGGSGVVVLPCGAGKTVVALEALCRAGMSTLVVCTTVSSVRQWIREALSKTSLTTDDVGEWSSERKELRPVTFVTYHSLAWSDRNAEPDAELEVRHPNLGLFDAQGWGLIVYDEVHLLPAPVFRATARIQAIRRLGLTATLVREDGREGDIFSLIGPKRFDVAWSSLENQGWIAPATCTEIRVPLAATRPTYARSEPRQRHRIAATAAEKLPVIDDVIARHPDEQVLVIGQFVEQLKDVAAHLDAPLITGSTGQATRDKHFAALRDGSLDVLVVSKVGNFSIDLPEVSVAIQISGQYGSRQEEAQRLGRIVRPKMDGRQASFYTIVADDTDEVRFARNRQRFLAEQGYEYRIETATA